MKLFSKIHNKTDKWSVSTVSSITYPKGLRKSTINHFHEPKMTLEVVPIPTPSTDIKPVIIDVENNTVQTPLNPANVVENIPDHSVATIRNLQGMEVTDFINPETQESINLFLTNRKKSKLTFLPQREKIDVDNEEAIINNDTIATEHIFFADREDETRDEYLEDDKTRDEYLEESQEEKAERIKLKHIYLLEKASDKLKHMEEKLEDIETDLKKSIGNPKLKLSDRNKIEKELLTHAEVLITEYTNATDQFKGELVPSNKAIGILKNIAGAQYTSRVKQLVHKIRKGVESLDTVKPKPQKGGKSKK